MSPHGLVTPNTSSSSLHFDSFGSGMSASGYGGLGITGIGGNGFCGDEVAEASQSGSDVSCQVPCWRRTGSSTYCFQDNGSPYQPNRSLQMRVLSGNYGYTNMPNHEIRGIVWIIAFHRSSSSLEK